MDEIAVKIDILHKALDRKKGILTQIINITENQQMFFETLKGEELKYYMNVSIEEKQKLIDELNDIDTAFTGIFESFKGKLNENKQKYRNEIISMQDKIQELIELDIKIRAKEEHSRRTTENMLNRQLVETPKIKGLKASKNYIMDQYEKNSEKRNKD